MAWVISQVLQIYLLEREDPHAPNDSDTDSIYLRSFLILTRMSLGFVMKITYIINWKFQKKFQEDTET